MWRALIAPAALIIAGLAQAAEPAKLEPVRVARDGKSFVLEPSGKKFIHWGFNYDHDAKGRLIEDYWTDEWPAIAGDFAEMKQLGANVVRVHLQFGKFMSAPDKPNSKAIDRLGDLVKLAEKTGLYLDLTGLGCYHKADVPEWYDKLSESDRWATQARFWEAVAGRCKESAAVFCYDLMNEPVVPGGKRKPGDWLGPPFGDKHFVQVITLDQADRKRPDIAREWVKHLAGAIRKTDKNHLITVGLVDWSLDKPGLTSGFVPKAIADDLDFLAVHIYPQAGKVDEAIETLKGFAVGKPIVIEETFPLRCGRDEFESFLKKSEDHAAGWIGFYWGTPPEELKKEKGIASAMLLGWLEVFQKRGKELGVIP
jgi:Cellulase (glycosyl hydrolase family 5)